MDFIKLVESRYSARSFLEKEVEQEKLFEVLEAARLAPSACNIQPIRLIVITKKENRERLKSSYDRAWFYNAPVIIIVCCDMRVAWKRGDGKEYGPIDAAIAMDHITLAATNLGLGTCWIGAFKSKELRNALDIPEQIEPIALTPLGYPTPMDIKKSRKPLEDLVFWETYKGK